MSEVTQDISRISTGRLARVGGAIAGVAVILLVAVYVWSDPFGDRGTGTAGGLVMAWIAFWGLIAVVAATTERPGVLVACFVLSFFLPWGIGIYLLGTPGIFRWIPVAQFGYVVAATAMFLSDTDRS